MPSPNAYINKHSACLVSTPMAKLFAVQICKADPGAEIVYMFVFIEYRNFMSNYLKMKIKGEYVHRVRNPCFKFQLNKKILFHLIYIRQFYKITCQLMHSLNY